MTALGIARTAAVILGLAVLSPAQALVPRALLHFSGLLLLLLPLADVLALAVVAWGLRSTSGAAFLGTLAASPWLLYFKPEAGEWAYLFATPELLLLGGLGWYAWRKESRVSARWLGALAPTLAIVYGMLAPILHR